MPGAILKRIDPMVLLLVAAIALAIALPAAGRWHEAAQWAANAAVFVLFLLNGLRLPRGDVLAGIGNWRVLGALAVWSFAVMPLLGWSLWHLTAAILPPLLALGFLYCGVLPSTVQSATAYASLAGGNVALSVVAAALLNILGVFISAPIFALLGGAVGAGTGLGGLAKVFVMLLLPFALGQVLQGRLGGWASAHRPLVTRVDRLSIAIAVYVAFSGAVIERFWNRVDATGWTGLALGVATMVALAHAGAWALGRMLGRPRPERITILFAGAQKSIAMGAPLATILFPPEATGIVLLPILLYHLVQLVIAAPLAARLARGT
jgi:sodium/bile acid cotransporter 7